METRNGFVFLLVDTNKTKVISLVMYNHGVYGSIRHSAPLLSGLSGSKQSLRGFHLSQQDVEVASTAGRVYNKWQKLIVEKTKKMGFDVAGKEDETCSDPVDNTDLTCQEQPSPLPDIIDILQ